MSSKWIIKLTIWTRPGGTGRRVRIGPPEAIDSSLSVEKELSGFLFIPIVNLLDITELARTMKTHRSRSRAPECDSTLHGPSPPSIGVTDVSSKTDQDAPARASQFFVPSPLPALAAEDYGS